MSTNSQNTAYSKISELMETTGVLLLLLHFYLYGYVFYQHWGWSNFITDAILEKIIRTGLFVNPMYTKFGSLLFIFLGMVIAPKRKKPRFDRRGILSVGCVLMFILYFYYAFPMYWINDESGKADYIVYLVVSVLNFSCILYFLGQLLRYMPLPWPLNDPFGKLRTGFPQERRRIGGPFALQLRGSYLYNGRKHRSWINICNPRRGVLIVGSPGAGKSRFIIEPLIRQLIEKGFSLVLYDFKFDALSKVVYNHFLANRKQYPDNTAFYCIQFSEPRRSHRCNVLDPDTMEWFADAIGIARTILYSLNRNWVDRQGDFFVESPISFLANLIWFLHEYKNGIYCTLPHVIELSKLPYDKLWTVLGTEPYIASMIDPFIRAYADGSMEMLDGQVTAAKIPLMRLSSPDIYYILTGNDLDLRINNPKAPKILCLGSDPTRMDALSPILSLYIDRINRVCNRYNQHPMGMVCDEFATIRAINVLTTLGTGRSNNIIPILAVQDISQIRTLYSKDEADWMMSVNANLFCGQVGGETARRVSERFPQILRERTSISVNSTDSTISRHQEWEACVTPATVANLSSGEFVGLVSDNPEEELPLKAFHARIPRSDKDEVELKDLPIGNEVKYEVIMKTYEQVRVDIEGIVAEVTRGIMDGMENMC